MNCSSGCAWTYDGLADAADPRRLAVRCDDPFRIRCRVCESTLLARCGTSRASKCAPCSVAYVGRVGVVAGSGYRYSPDGTYFVTLTAPGASAHRVAGEHCPCTPVGGADLRAWNASCSKRWNRFMTYLRRVYGEAAYFRGVEVQRRGALHVHAIIRLPAGSPPLSASRVRALAIACGFGHQSDVQGVEARHAGYVAKYVAKAADQRTDVPWYGLTRQRGQAVVTAQGEFLGWRFRNGDVRESERRLWPSWSPSYRTWSASRSWGDSMAAVLAAQAHYAAVIAALPADGLWPEDCVGACPVRPDAILSG